MNYILDLFKGYEVDYNRKLGIITIHKKMDVKDFIYFRLLLKLSKEPIKDIRIYGERIYYERDEHR